MEVIKYGRKRNGIKKQLIAKADDWLKTIDDEELVEKIRKDLILTGGAIASMLLGDKVNDYDFYFRTKETTIAVAEYYVERFNKKFLEKRGKDAVHYTPEVKQELRTNIKGKVEERVLIWMQSAGVAAAEQEEYNYFEMMDDNAATSFAESLDETTPTDAFHEKYTPAFLSENAISLTNKVQLIVRFYGSPDEIHDNYDFEHAKCYYDYASGELVLPPESLECLLSRTLIYRGSLYPVASIFRMKKFLSRGWRITAGQQLKIMWQISEIDLTDMNTIREQLTGVDMAYMWQLIEALKGVNPEKIDSAYVSTIIDKIFE